MFQAPNGSVFYAGPGPDSKYLNPYYVDQGTGQAGQWTELGTQGRSYHRAQGTAAMFAPGRILVAGGSDGRSVTNTTEVIDLSNSAGTAGNYSVPVITPAAPMRYARHHVNSTLLPDGTVLVTGGSRVTDKRDRSQAVLETELWNPPPPYGTGAAPGGTWTTLASMSEARMYHSTAVLLPDGRVLSAGGEEVIRYIPTFPYFYPNVDNHCTAELFSPPYLFKGAQPTVSGAPAYVGYGQPFTILADPGVGGRSLSRVTLVRLSSVTHSFNQNKRFLELPIISQGTGAAAGTLNVAAPADPNDCPPGHYWLYVLDSQGVPSVGKVLAIGASACAAAPQVSLTYSAVDNCSGLTSATVSGANLGTDFRWTINGTYDPGYDGQATVTVGMNQSQPHLTVGVRVTPSCGGQAVENFASITHYFSPGHCP